MDTPSGTDMTADLFATRVDTLLEIAAGAPAGEAAHVAANSQSQTARDEDSETTKPYEPCWKGDLGLARIVVCTLLDDLAVLKQKLPLRVSTRLFTLLSDDTLLETLVGLLPVTECPGVEARRRLMANPDDATEGDRGAASALSRTLRAKQNMDARWDPPYPFLVSRILSYGSQQLRTKLIESPSLLPTIINMLLPSHTLDTSSTSQLPPSTNSDGVNEAVMRHIVAVLESFFDDRRARLPLLEHFAARPSLVSTLVQTLHHGPTAELLLLLVPERGADDSSATGMMLGGGTGTLGGGAGGLSSDGFGLPGDHMSPATVCVVRLLAAAALPSQLAAVFERASTQVLQSYRDGDASGDTRDHVMRLQNSAYVYGSVFAKLVPVFRMHRTPSGMSSEAAAATDAAQQQQQQQQQRQSDELMRACFELSVFENALAAQTLGSMLDAGVAVLKESSYACTAPLYEAINCCVRLLDAVVAERGRRVLNLSQTPRPVVCSALDGVVVARVRVLVEILIDTAKMDKGFELCRVRILDLFVAAHKACDGPTLYAALDKMRFAEVVLRLVQFHPKNSVLHGIVSSAVEVALVSDWATEASRVHWLVKSKLVDKLLTLWTRLGGLVTWLDPGAAQKAPSLSMVVHMACCVEQLRAMIGGGAFGGLVGGEIGARFNAFCMGDLAAVMRQETLLLGGVRPPRRRGERLSSSSFSNSAGFGSFSSHAPTLGGDGGGAFRGGAGAATAAHPNMAVGRSACSQVASPSAHRFGYVPPPPPRGQPPSDELRRRGSDASTGSRGSHAASGRAGLPGNLFSARGENMDVDEEFGMEDLDQVLSDGESASQGARRPRSANDPLAGLDSEDTDDGDDAAGAFGPGGDSAESPQGATHFESIFSAGSGTQSSPGTGSIGGSSAASRQLAQLAAQLRAQNAANSDSAESDAVPEAPR